MRVLLLTFSGTGNTKICGDFIKSHFIENGYDVDHYVYDYNNDFTYDVNDYDLIGLGYPIHAFNTPELFVRFVKKLPTSDKPFFIYKVSGEPFPFNNASSVKIKRILKKKGYKYIAEKHFLMPYNIIFRYKDSLAKQMYLYLNPLAKAFVLGIINNTPEIVKNNFLERVWTQILRIEWVGPKVNKFLLHSKKDKCTKCGLCIKNCPTNSLYINKKGIIKAKGTCAFCMRCSYNCPHNALNMGMLNGWVVNGPYKYLDLTKNKDVPSYYVHANTKGYFKLFRKYFYKQNKILKQYNISIPCDYKKDEELENLKY